MGGEWKGSSLSLHPFSTHPTAPQIFIKDVKSSNGTFVNGERLSPEGVESEPFELENDDIVVCHPLFSDLIPPQPCLLFFRNSVLTSLVRTIEPPCTTKSPLAFSVCSQRRMPRTLPVWSGCKIPKTLLAILLSRVLLTPLLSFHCHLTSTMNKTLPR